MNFRKHFCFHTKNESSKIFSFLSFSFFLSKNLKTDILFNSFPCKYGFGLGKADGLLRSSDDFRIKPWTWDGLRADTAVYLVVPQAGAQSTASIKPCLMQRGSALFRVSPWRALWCNTWQQWDKPDSAAAFLFPSSNASVWGPAASLASFWKPHEG